MDFGNQMVLLCVVVFFFPAQHEDFLAEQWTGSWLSLADAIPRQSICSPELVQEFPLFLCSIYLKKKKEHSPTGKHSRDALFSLVSAVSSVQWRFVKPVCIPGDGKLILESPQKSSSLSHHFQFPFSPKELLDINYQFGSCPKSDC